MHFYAIVSVCHLVSHLSKRELTTQVGFLIVAGCLLLLLSLQSSHEPSDLPQWLWHDDIVNVQNFPGVLLPLDGAGLTYSF